MANEVGRSNAARVRQEFRIEQTVDRYQQLWQSLAGQEKNFRPT
jgi:hypothetical protein